MEEPEVSVRQLVEPREDATEVLDLADEAFDQMTLSVEILVIGVGHPPVGARRCYRNCIAPDDRLKELVRVVCSVCNHILTIESIYEFLSLGDIVLLPSGQPVSQRVAESVDTDMDLCTEPTSAAPEGLRCLSSSFFDAPAAEWWARTTVLSMMRCSISGSSTRYWCIRSHTPRSHHRAKRL